MNFFIKQLALAGNLKFRLHCCSRFPLSSSYSSYFSPDDKLNWGCLGPVAFRFERWPAERTHGHHMAHHDLLEGGQFGVQAHQVHPGLCHVCIDLCACRSEHWPVRCDYTSHEFLRIMWGLFPHSISAWLSRYRRLQLGCLLMMSLLFVTLRHTTYVISISHKLLMRMQMNWRISITVSEFRSVNGRDWQAIAKWYNFSKLVNSTKYETHKNDPILNAFFWLV